jgi:hypothetical protein
MSTLRGRNLRVWFGSLPLGGSTNCTITLNTSSTDSTTKDDGGIAGKSEITEQSWSIQVDSMSLDDIPVFLDLAVHGTKFLFFWAETSGDDNSTVVTQPWERYGMGLISDFTLDFNDREISVKNVQITGTGPLSINVPN